MSIEVGVWFEAAPINDARVADRYEDLRAEAVEDVTPVHPRAVAFYLDLTGRHVDDGDADDAGARYTPWAVDIVTTPVAVFMTVVSDDAEESVRSVHELARRHELVCHVPRTGATSIPDFVRNGTTLAMASYDGAQSMNPAPAHIAHTLQRLSADNSFVLLMWWDDGRFLQVDFGDSYTMDYSHPVDGSGGVTTTVDLEVVIETFQRYAAGDPSWTDHAAWQ